MLTSRFPRPQRVLVLLTVALGLATRAIGAMSIQINAGSGLSANPEALAAINRAKDAWATKLTASSLYQFDIDLVGMASATSGSASIPIVFNNYDDTRTFIDNVHPSSVGASAIAALPASGASFTVNAPAGATWNTHMDIRVVQSTKANFKAIGYGSTVDFIFGASDGTLTFNSNYAYDYNRADGITPGFVDFESVAIREFGRALGFISSVDTIAPGSTYTPTLLDLFRFNTAAQPASLADLSLLPRELRPGENAVLSTGLQSWSLSTGVSHDGFQSSSWKSATLTGTLIGAMEPSFATGAIYDPSAADLYAMSLLGYHVSAIPEPAEIATCLAAAALLAVTIQRRRASASARPTS